MITPRHIAQTLATYLQGDWLPQSARLVPLVNMVEDAETQRAGTELAAALLDLIPRADRVVIAHMAGEKPLVGVVGR